MTYQEKNQQIEGYTNQFGKGRLYKYDPKEDKKRQQKNRDELEAKKAGKDPIEMVGLKTKEVMLLFRKHSKDKRGVDLDTVGFATLIKDLGVAFYKD